jgi:hypothetical protein
MNALHGAFAQIASGSALAGIVGARQPLRLEGA